MAVTLAQLLADAQAISKTSPAIRKFAIDAATYLQQQAPPAPTPTPAPVPTPAPSGALDDMRAIHMSALSSQIVTTPYTDTVVDKYGNPMGPGWTVNRSQTPADFWDGDLMFVDDDITLVADARYGQVYRFRITGNSRNPYWSTPTVANTTLVKNRTLSIGQWDWYGLAILWEPTWDWSVTDWSVILQCAYPVISSPPLGLFAGYGDNVYVQSWAGPVTAGGGKANIWNVRTQSAIQGHWLECVLGVKWGSNNDGEVHYLDRCKDLGEATFTERVTATGLTTWQWGGSAPQNPSNLPVYDKLDCYRGYKTGYTDDNVPTNYVRHTGHVRCADKATCLAYMGS